MAELRGKPLRLDPNAKSAWAEIPAFLAPAGCAVYHGFAIIPETVTDGWAFGAISEYIDPDGCDEGDAFVVAPDGSRAGLVWSVGDFLTKTIRDPDSERWGVYSVAFPKPTRTTADFAECCRAILPELKLIHAKLRGA